MDMRNAEKRAKMDHDLLEALEYLAGFDPCYYEPAPEKKEESNPVWEKFQQTQQRGWKHRAQAPKRFTSAMEMS